MRATSEPSRIPASKKTASSQAALRLGGIAVTVAGLTGVAWFVLELMPPLLGFDDTDSPAVSLTYLRLHPQFYAVAGLTLFIMATANFVASFAVSDLLAPRDRGITHRSLTALGLIAALLVFMHGVLRESVAPLLYIDSLDRRWGESAYLTLQMVGIHGFAGAGFIALSVWIVCICAAGLRFRTLPIWLCVWGLIAGLRLVLMIAGPLTTTAALDLPGWLWVASMALIPLGMLWWLALGVVLLVKSRA